jgi:hypothetical protein
MVRRAHIAKARIESALHEQLEEHESVPRLAYYATLTLPTSSATL